MKPKKPFALAAILSFLLIAANTNAQEFPRKAITLVIPYAAGGVTDQITRLLASKVADNIGHSVIIENRPGGGGQIAASTVRQAPPDGYTILVGDIGTHAINATLYRKLAYDPAKDFLPIIELVEMPHVLVVPPQSPFTTMAALIAAARQQPGSLTYGSVGIGSGAHLLGEMLKADEKIEIVHAPYRGSSQIVPDLMSNRIAMFFGALGSMAPLIREGKLAALLLTDKQRSPLLPKVPTAAEAGTPRLDLRLWFGLLAPAGTPSTIIDRINKDFMTALNQPDVRQRLGEWGVSVIGNSPKQFADVIAADTARLGEVVKSAGARLD
jgi:tripartite-type tricarboxylate transporter receptor subunit TctC